MKGKIAVLENADISHSYNTKSQYSEDKDYSTESYEAPKITKPVASNFQSSEGADPTNPFYSDSHSSIPSPRKSSSNFKDSDSSNLFYSDTHSQIPSPRKNSSNFRYNDKFNSTWSATEESYSVSDFKANADCLDDINLRGGPEASTASERVRNNLLKVVEKFPHGIWAREFPALYKNVTGTKFDLHSLGFYDLASFIDSIPDILTRRSLPNSKKDYLIYPAWSIKEMDPNDPKSAAFAVEIIIGNTRKILQANEEGIPLKEFLYVYSLNCSEPLYFVDLGFGSLENLLTAIADRVPLKVQIKDGVKSVHLVLFEKEKSLPYLEDSEPLPPDIVSPFKQFTQQTLPAELDLSQYFPVFISNVINPEHIYIQLSSESDTLHKKYHDLEKFYASSQNKNYVMKDVHIKPGAIGVAVWPVDKFWYRIRVMSVTSPDTVKVFYVDYGTICVIPKTLLRYIRKEFFDFPAQAIKASIACVKPPLPDNAWDIRTRARILNLCTDITLMARIHNIEYDGVLSLLLCDTNGKKDIYINDILLEENLARSPSDSDSSSQPQHQHCPEPASKPVVNASQPLSTLQASDPSQVLGMLLQACSSLAKNSSSPNTAKLPVDPSVVTTAIMQAAQNLSQNPAASGVDFSKLFQSPSVQPPTSPIPCPKPAAPDSTSFQFPSEDASCSSVTTPSDDSCEVFDDDVDAFFDEFCEKLCLVSKRYVKRIVTDDGYMFHIIIYESRPFVSCGDISGLIWTNKDSDHLLQRLQNMESNLPNILIWENQNKDMFDQLRKFHVKGFKELNDETNLLIYPLNTLVQILNIFGHPSAELRTRIVKESASFNLNNPLWMELSEVEIPDGKEEFAGKTDDDKLNRLCLYDLQTMKHGIRIRRQNLELQQSKNPEEVADENEKLKNLFGKVVGRIKEIQQICSNFADA